jgi:hypothetical protein
MPIWAAADGFILQNHWCPLPAGWREARGVEKTFHRGLSENIPAMLLKKRYFLVKDAMKK